MVFFKKTVKAKASKLTFQPWFTGSSGTISRKTDGLLNNIQSYLCVYSCTNSGTTRIWFWGEHN